MAMSLGAKRFLSKEASEVKQVRAFFAGGKPAHDLQEMVGKRG